MATSVPEPWNDPGARPLIEFRNVTKRFGDFVAIDGQSLDIHEGEFFALLGPSGCGKTTMMRMLAGFETPSEGSIRLAGRDIASVPPNRRPVNMMFQSYALFPHLSVWENIAFGLRREGLPRERIDQRVSEMLGLVRLEDFARRKPHQISGGQRQRVALARSLAKAPKLLLLDEPLGALDAKLRQDTQFELMDIQEKTGTTFVIVTHDQEEAMTVASRVAVMDHGRIVQVDTPDRIYEIPNSVYVADFISDVTIIEGRAARAGDGYEIAFDESQPPLFATSDLRPRRGAGGPSGDSPRKGRRVGGAARGRPQRFGGEDSRHRLSRQSLHLPRRTARRAGGEGPGREHEQAGQPPVHLGRQGLAILGRRRGRPAGGIGMRRAILILVPYMWLLALFLAPFAIVFRMSMSDVELSIPPYTPKLDLSGGVAAIREFVAALDFENYAFLASDDLYWKAYLSSLWIALVSTLLALLVGYPVAYAMARAPWRLAADADDAGDSSVLDQLPDSGLLLDRNPLDRGLPEPASLGARADFGTARPAEHHDGGLYRQSSTPICRS